MADDQFRKGFIAFDPANYRPRPETASAEGFRTFGVSPSPENPDPPVMRETSGSGPVPPAPPRSEDESPPVVGRKIADLLAELKAFAARHKRGIGRGAASLAALLLLFLAVRFIASIDFTSPAAQEKEAPAQEATSPAVPGPVTAGPEMEPAKGYGFVRSDGPPVNLYEEPSDQAAVIEQMPNRSLVYLQGYITPRDQAREEGGRWCKLSYRGTEGWAREKDIEVK